MFSSLFPQHPHSLLCLVVYFPASIQPPMFSSLFPSIHTVCCKITSGQARVGRGNSSCQVHWGRTQEKKYNLPGRLGNLSHIYSVHDRKQSRLRGSSHKMVLMYRECTVKKIFVLILYYIQLYKLTYGFTNLQTFSFSRRYSIEKFENGVSV